LGSVRRLRQLQVLLASRDPGFAKALSYLLSRHGVDTVGAMTLGHLDDLIERSAVTLAVFDVDTFPGDEPADAAIAATDRLVPVIAVSDRPDRSGPQNVHLLPKWRSFDRVLAEIERLHAARPRVGAIVQPEIPPGYLYPARVRATDVVA
jgi:hypothetical protein